MVAVIYHVISKPSCQILPDEQSMHACHLSEWVLEWMSETLYPTPKSRHASLGFSLSQRDCALMLCQSLRK